MRGKKSRFLDAHHSFEPHIPLSSRRTPAERALGQSVWGPFQQSGSCWWTPHKGDRGLSAAMFRILLFPLALLGLGIAVSIRLLGLLNVALLWALGEVAVRIVTRIREKQLEPTDKGLDLDEISREGGAADAEIEVTRRPSADRDSVHLGGGGANPRPRGPPPTQPRREPRNRTRSSR